MHFFSYRNRIFLRRLLLVLGALLLIAAVCCVCLLAYLDRFVVYDRNGAHIDPEWKSKQGSVISISEPSMQAQITYVSAENDLAESASRPISGCYVTTGMLRDLTALRTAVTNGKFSAVMFDLKDKYGRFYYPSTVGIENLTGSVDVTEVAGLIRELQQSGRYLIARIPAFLDQRFCLDHIPVGLPLSSGALWADEDNCYCMDPANSETVSYLETVCLELQELGFREVVLDGFAFPDTDRIVYPLDRPKEEILAETASVLQEDLSVMNLRVSFGIGISKAFPGFLNEGRVYLSLNQGNQLESVANVHSQSVANAPTQLVFLTDSRDTRFSSYGLLTPAVSSGS